MLSVDLNLKQIPMKRSKAKQQTRHAIQRARQRFDLVMSESDITRIIEMIQAGRCKHIEKQSRRVSMFQVMLDQQVLYAAYDKQRKTIATFLTQDMVIDETV